MEKGQYYYSKQGETFAIFKCGETINGIRDDENLHETIITQEEASERVYKLNGWKWKKKSNPTPTKKEE
jgi:hypothetical protein